MPVNDSVVAIYETHDGAETGVRRLSAAGFDMEDLSIVGKGYHTEEKVVGFYNVGERVDLWAKRGAYWGGMCGLFIAGMTVTIPAVGGVVVLGFLTSALSATLQGALVAGGVSALGAAFYSVGIPEDSVIEYETALKADRFLVLVNGDAEAIARADAVLSGSNLIRIHRHANAGTGERNGKLLSITA